MSVPSEDNVSLPALEADVVAELAMVEASHPEQEMDLPISEWLFDPVEAEEDEVGLRTLLGAVETLESPAPHPLGAKVDPHGGDWTGAGPRACRGGRREGRAGALRPRPPPAGPRRPGATAAPGRS